MRIIWWLGGISLTALLACGGCSSDGGENAPVDSGLGGKNDAGADVKVQMGGGGGREAGTGGSTPGVDGSVADGPLDARVPGVDGSVDARTADVAWDAFVLDSGRDSSQQDVVQQPDSSPDVGADGSSIPDTGPQRDATADGPADGGACRVSATGMGACEARTQFDTTTGSIAGVMTVTACPNGADTTTGVCIAQGDFGKAQWSVTGARTLEGTVGLMAQDIPARIRIVTIERTCHLSIGGPTYAQVPVTITLPQGMSANGFVPGCTAVTGLQVALRGDVAYEVTGTNCAEAKVLAEANGGLDTLKEAIQSLIAKALEGRICTH